MIVDSKVLSPSKLTDEKEITGLLYFLHISSSVITDKRSDLLSKIITFLSIILLIINSSSPSKGLDESITNKIKSASSIESSALSTPIFSTISSVSLIPAVSIILRETPLIVICSSRVSRVVPGISVTIARSLLLSVFKREDLPALGLPRIKVLIPSFKIWPELNELIKSSILLIIESTLFFKSSGYPVKS